MSCCLIYWWMFFLISPHIGYSKAGSDSRAVSDSFMVFILFIFRFMATNDLMTELQKDSIKLDDDSERKVCFCWFT